MLFCSWTELDVTSGTPVILCDLLAHFGPGRAEAVTEFNADNKRRREIHVEHPIHKVRFHQRLWPFRRGSRIRRKLARMGTPLLVAALRRRVREFRPDAIFTVYAQAHWILATWLVSRLTGVPLIYHVHDAFLEQTHGRRNSRFASWLERKTLTSARVLVLHDHLAEHYRERYGIECTVLRHIVRHAPLPAAPQNASGECVIGFSGAVYDSNSRQLTELARRVADDPRLKLKIWSGESEQSLRAMGIDGPRVEIGYESNYERLLGHLAGCDLLYLPLAFHDGTNIAADSLQFSFPTKSLDYLLTGRPILVHCPAEFELSRFFVKHNCGYVLNDAPSEAVGKWLDAWRAGRVAPLDDADRLRTLALYSPEENKRLLWKVLGEEVDRAAGHATRGEP